MTGRTGQNVPYALASDPLVDYPPVSQEVAGLVRLAPTTPGGAIPAGTFDGQEYLLDVTPGGGGRNLWRLRWSASKARWFFIGGAPLYGMKDGPLTQPSGGWTNDQPSLVVPVPGVYRVRFGCEAAPAAAGVYASMGVQGAGLLVTNYFPPYILSAAAGQNFSLSTEREFTLPTAGTGWSAVTIAYQASGGSVVFQRLFLSMQPVVLGGV